MKKIRPFRLSDEVVAKLDKLCGGNRTEWVEKVIEAGGNFGGMKFDREVEGRVRELGEKMGLSGEGVVKMAVMELWAKQEGLPKETPDKNYTVLSPGGNLMKMVRDELTKPVPQPDNKRAVFESLRARFGGERAKGEEEVKPLSDTPCAPFDVNIEGEAHRVSTYGKKLGIYYLGVEPMAFVRELREGELETLWAGRVK